MNIIIVERITVSTNSKAVVVALTAVLDRPTNITTYQLQTINVKT